MTRRERLMAIFQGQIPDRPAVKLWGVGTKKDSCVHPAFEHIRDLAVARTDLVRGTGSREISNWLLYVTKAAGYAEAMAKA